MKSYHVDLHLRLQLLRRLLQLLHHVLLRLFLLLLLLLRILSSNCCYCFSSITSFKLGLKVVPNPRPFAPELSDLSTLPSLPLTGEV